MAQETVLKISLKEYKQGIDELRAALLGLDKDSEEYSKIVEQIAERQDKLNDVMNAGKQTVNAVDGSYNALAQTLSQLKKEWKNMEMGTPEWEAMAVRINDINNQLKDADASVGVFTRNVGDYANAFEEAFKQAAGGLSKLPGPLGEIGSMTNRLIPLIKKANTTATTGLNGVKKALVSTGIGALIVAVGMLIAHFDDLRKMFKKDSPVEEADKRFKELKTSIDKSNAEIEREIELMEAAGVSTQEVIDKKIELLKVQKSLVVAEGLYIKSQIDEIEKHGKIRRWITGENKDLEELNEKYKELYQQDQKYIELIADAENSKEADKIRKRKAAAEEEKKQLDEVLKKVKENSQSEIQTLTEKYNKELALLKKYGKDTTELTKQYEKDRRKIIEQTTDQLYSKLGEYDPNTLLARNFSKAIDEVYKFQEAVDKKFPPEGLIEAKDVTVEMIAKAKELGLTVGNTAEDFALSYRIAYQDYKRLNEEFLNSVFKQTDAYRKAEKELGHLKEGTAEWYNANLTLVSSVSENINKAIEENKKYLREAGEQFFDAFLNRDTNGMQKAYDTIKQITKSITEWKEALYNADKEVEKAADDVDKFNEQQRRTIEIAKNETDILEKEFGKDSWTQWFSNTSQFYEIYQARLDAAIWYRDNLEVIEGESAEARKKRELEAEQAILNIKREYAKKHIEISQTLGGHLTSIWGSLNDIYESNAKAQGKTDEEIFNQTKGSKIALGWVETIQGSLASFMGYQQYPQPYGALLGAAAAAATFAAGVAQIEAIKATQFDSAGNNVSNPTAVINATPRMSDYQPNTIQNLTGASETQNLANALQQTPIIVRVSDIDSAQDKVQARVAEASF